MKKQNTSSQKILFVCLGNICRSPTGEGVLQAQVLEQGLQDLIFVDSAGTMGYHIGHAADARMQQAAGRRGIKLLSRARKVTCDDLETFELVIAMDRENFADLQTLHPQPTADIKLLSDFLDESWPTDVPDPYYGGSDGFEYVMDMIEAACPNILQHLRSLK